MSIRLIGIVGLVALVAGCVGGQNEDDYRKAKLQEELAKIQMIAGTYQGALNASSDNKSLGSVLVELHPDTDLQKSVDNISSEQRVVVRGTLTYRGVTEAAVNLEGGYFDDITHIFKAAASVPMQDGKTTVSLDLQGLIENGVFTGTIEAEGYPEFGGSFTLNKDGGQNLSSPTVNSGRADSINIGKRTYHGQDQGGDDEIFMYLASLDQNSAQSMVGLFVPVRAYSVNVKWLRPDDSAFWITFNQAQYDERNQELTAAEDATTSDGGKVTATLDCKLRGAGNGANWSCVMAAGNTVNRFTAKAQSNPRN